MNSIFLKNSLLAVLSGVLLIFAFPSFSFSFLAWIALVPLVVALEKKGYKESFLLGLITGLIFYAGTLYWIVGTLKVYGEFSWISALFVGMVLVSYLAFYFGLFGLVASFFNRYFYSSIIFTLSALWVALEYIRTYLLTGFPWNLLGYSQWNNLVAAQIAVFTGVYGVSFLIVLVNVFAAKILSFTLEITHRRPSLRSVEIAIVILVAGIGYGWFVIIQDPGVKKERGLKIAIIQPNIEPDTKWEPEQQSKVMDTYGSFVDRVKNNALSLIVFPETAVPGLLRYNPYLWQKTVQLADLSHAYVFIGSIDKRNGAYFTSCFGISPDGAIAGQYDKNHLVPFGEIFPFRSLVEKIFPQVRELGDFSPGEGPTPISVAHGKFGVNICYEDIFPDLIRRLVKNGAEVLVNITIDSWYLRTSAPYQHYAVNVFRAIENRRWVVRSAATGISGFIDPYGYVINETHLFQPEISICQITPETRLTFYSKYGDVFAKGALLWTIFGLIGGVIRRKANV